MQRMINLSETPGEDDLVSEAEFAALGEKAEQADAEAHETDRLALLRGEDPFNGLFDAETVARFRLDAERGAY